LLKETPLMIRHARAFRASSICALVIAIAAFAVPARAQTDDDDARLRPAEPDFVVINLPTTLPLPVKGGNFHLTHRFNENLRHDSFSDQVQNLFGLDNGANIGLEFRFGVAKHLEAVVQRTSISRTIQFSGKYDAWHQTATRPVSLSGIVAVEGDNNFRQSYAPALGVVVGRTLSDRLALYATPFWVHNTQTGGLETRDTGFLGLGARVRFLETAYLVGEVTPRIGGFTIGDPEYAFAIEKRVGAHVFALTFSNGASTTFRQLAHGGVPEALYLGFNLTRKFF
jgi:hypothetical protein